MSTQDIVTLDLTVLKELIRQLPDVLVFVRTTFFAGTSVQFSKETRRSEYCLPEFLAERTHIEDFYTQPMVFAGVFEFF